MNTSQQEAIDFALSQNKSYFTISLKQNQNFDDFVESVRKIYPRWSVKASKTVCAYETYADLVFAKTRICDNCKHIASDTHGDNWNEPMVNDEYCSKGQWEYEPENENMAANCPLYEYYDWDAHYKAEAESEFQYFEEMKLAEEEYKKMYGMYGISSD